MPSPVDTYSRQGFLYTLGFAAVVVAVSSLVAFLSAPEVVTCLRASGVRVDCALARSLAGRLPVKTATVENVAELGIVEFRERVGFGQSRRAAREPVYRLRFGAPSGEFFSVQSPYDELASVRTSIQQMLEGKSATELRAVLHGSPGVHPWSVGALIFGLALVPLWVLGYFVPALRPNSG